MVEPLLIDLKALLVEREDCDAGTVQKLREGLAQGKTQYRTLREVTEALRKKVEGATGTVAKRWQLKLGIALFLGRWIGGAQAMVTATKIFVVVWLAVAALNMWMGVARAGYSVAEEFPIFLTTGRVVSQYLSGTQTRRIGPLVDQAPEPRAEIHPRLAEAHGIANEDWVEVTTRAANVEALKLCSAASTKYVFKAFASSSDGFSPLSM